jgi:gamma-glutamylcyclotransferase
MHYLAYGSNLHPLRLILRVPSARLVGVTQLEGYRLAFHKRSTDGSSKCDLRVTGDPRDLAFGAVFDIRLEEVALLDAAEGVGNGYYKAQLQVKVSGARLDAFAYLASESHLVSDLEPYHWYKGFVAAGARKHRFPDYYVQQIADTPSKFDPNECRRIEMDDLLVRLRA